MKIRSTTSIQMSYDNLKRTILAVIAGVMVFSIPAAYVSQVSADRYDDQLRGLQAQANQFQSIANDYRAKADTLQNKLDQINAQKGAIESQIAISQAKNQQLTADITANEKKIQDTQAALGKTLASLYVDDKVSPLEMLAGSNNISDYVDKQEYRSSVRDQLKSSIDTIKKLKKQLEDDKKALEKVLADLDVQNKQLAAVQAEQQRLVDLTRGEEAAYQQLVANTQSQMQSVQAQQQAYYASLLAKNGGSAGVVGSFQYSGWSGNLGACGGGYGYSPAQGRDYCRFGHDAIVDEWNLYNRECVSYVAWALKYRFGKRVAAWHGDGNAMDWPYSAPKWSGAYRVSSPEPGDVVVLPASGGFAPIGHVMIVESASGDSMRVSQYNFYGTGQYSTMTVKNSGVILLRFPNA